MVQKKKLKRVDIGSIEAQRARGAKISDQPEPTSPVWSTPNFPSVARAQGVSMPTNFPSQQAQPQQPQLPPNLPPDFQPQIEQGFLDEFNQQPQQPAFGPEPATNQERFKAEIDEAMGNIGESFVEQRDRFEEQLGVAKDSAKKAILPAAAFAGGFLVGAELLTATIATATANQLQRLAYSPSAQAAAGKLFQTGDILVGATRIIPNTWTALKTASLLTKLGFAGAAAYTIKEIIGTYPFSGFIAEESLQTLSFGTKTAMDMESVKGTELADEALAKQAEVLNPEGWSKLMNAVPKANEINRLKEFFESATVKLGIDYEANEQMKLKLAGEGEESQFVKDTRLAEQIKTAGTAERSKFFEKEEPKKTVKETNFPPAQSFEEFNQQAEFARRAARE